MFSLIIHFGIKKYELSLTIDMGLLHMYHLSVLPVCAHLRTLRHRLLDDAEAWHDCLSDAADFKMPSQLRHLLAIILIFCEPAEPAKLSHLHEQALCEDLQFAKYGNNNTPEDDVINSALMELERHLQVHGKHVSDYEGFPRLRQHDLPPAIFHEFTAFIPHEEAAKGGHTVALLKQHPSIMSSTPSCRP